MGMDSYFAVDMMNFDSDGFITEGLKEAWCLDYQKPIDQNNDVHTGIKMFNTFGSDNWKPANYLMNIKDDLKAADPSLTYKEIQVALWSLIEVPSFNIDKAISEGSMPSRMMTNGSPNFSVEKTKGIINKVRNEVDDFVYEPGTPVIVYSNTAHNDQDMGIVLSGSAWGISQDSGSVNNFCKEKWTNLLDEEEEMPAKWGWSNGTYNSGDEDTFDIYVGASHCDPDNGDFVGTFNFKINGSNLSYTLNLTKNNNLANLHLHVGNEILPRNGGGKNGKGKLSGAPGKFGYTRSLDGGIKQYTNTISIATGEVYISLHLGDAVDE